MIPGEIQCRPTATLHLNEGRETVTLTRGQQLATGRSRSAATTIFSRPTRRSTSTATQARGMRLDIAAGTAVRFEPGQSREVTLVPIAGAGRVVGFNGKIMGRI